MDEQMIKQKQQQRQQKSDGQVLKELYGLVFIRGAEVSDDFFKWSLNNLLLLPLLLQITPKKISNRYQRPISQANKYVLSLVCDWCCGGDDDDAIALLTRLLEDFLSKYNGQNNNNKPLKVRYEFAGSKPKNGGVQNLDFVVRDLF